MSIKPKELLIAVAGQPNSGKSTIFNLLTGARQHVANYPGVTVEKKIGSFRLNGDRAVAVDLPGTYSLTSYTQEERIARDFLLLEKPDVVIDVADASNLERNLYLAFQLSEMGLPLVLDLNMMDVSKRRGFKIDIGKLSQELGMPVIPTIGNRGKGKKELRRAIYNIYENKNVFTPIRLDYGKTLEPILISLEKRLSDDQRLIEHYSARWLAVKLMENDSEAKRFVQQQAQQGNDILKIIAKEREKFITQYKKTPEKVIAQQRYCTAERIVKACFRQVSTIRTKPKILTDRIDRVVCNRFFGPLILAATIYVLYELSIVQGYKLTNYTWPFLSAFRDFIASILPQQGFIYDPILRAMPLGIINGIIAVLNYIPIFVILFTLVAILEDTGYMARMAFILDRIFRYFGLHGQSVLPLILGGVYVGGCAIPGIMACRGIKDERARMATIMIVPLMNCLAKIPLYVLLIGIFFTAHKGIAMFFIATITIIIALGVAKILNITVFRKRESAPFILEMPAYHLPTIGGVLRRCLERVWLFVKKIITVVIIVMAIVYFLISFPRLDKERTIYYHNQINQATQTFYKKIGKDNPYSVFVAGDKLIEFARYRDNYKKAKMRVRTNEAKEIIDQRFYNKNSEYFKIVKSGRYELDGKKIKDKNAAEVEKAYKRLDKVRKKLRRKWREETIVGSYLGRIGRFMEPWTKFAGFNWRVNIALLSSFAAKESSVATLGSIYQTQGDYGGKTLEKRIKAKEKNWTSLHALALMLFFAMFPPCIPALFMVKLETDSIKWVLFATVYPIILGFMIATLVFSGGNFLGLSGLQAMVSFYILALVVTTATAFIKSKPKLSEQSFSSIARN